MKKFLLSFLALGLALSAHAQSTTSWVYQYVQGAHQPLYRELADTVYKAKSSLRTGDRVLVVGQVGGWVQVRVGNQTFYTRRAGLSTVRPELQPRLDAEKVPGPRSLEELLKKPGRS